MGAWVNQRLIFKLKSFFNQNFLFQISVVDQNSLIWAHSEEKPQEWNG